MYRPLQCDQGAANPAILYTAIRFVSTIVLHFAFAPASWIYMGHSLKRDIRKCFFPDSQPMRVSEEPVCIDHFRQNPVFSSLHLRSPVHVVPPLVPTIHVQTANSRKILVLFKHPIHTLSDVK
jgi:hypothetical protein